VAKLIYSAITSLDGHVADARGSFEWAVPDDDVHAYVNDLERPVGLYLYGRRMYEVMVGWESPEATLGRNALAQDFADHWRSAHKLVYSRTLAAPISARTRVERTFDPTVIRQVKAGSHTDLAIGGASLAAQAFSASLVDECHLFVVPVVVGGGKRGLPEHVRLRFELLDVHRFNGGVVHLHYRTRT